MADADNLYAQLKPDLQQVAGALIDASQHFVRKRGHFLPHGAVLTTDDEVRFVMAAPDGFEEKLLSTTEVLPLLHDALRQAIADGSLRAIAVAEDVHITPEGRPESDAIKILVEHQRGLCIAFYVPFARGWLGRVKFDDMFAIHAEPEVRGW